MSHTSHDSTAPLTPCHKPASASETNHNATSASQVNHNEMSALPSVERVIEQFSEAPEHVSPKSHCNKEPFSNTHLTYAFSFVIIFIHQYQGCYPGLQPPTYADGSAITGKSATKLRLANKRQRQQLQLLQPPVDYWNTHEGKFSIPAEQAPPMNNKSQLRPSGLALHHPAAELLLKYAVHRCPAETGNHWTTEQIQAAINRGNHLSAKTPDAVRYFQQEISEKLAKGKVHFLDWEKCKEIIPNT